MAGLKECGTVISGFDSPSTRKFQFVVGPCGAVRRGQFVQIETQDGRLIARVAEIFKTNKYFTRPDSVREYQSSGRPMDEIFPVSEWECLVAEASALGVMDGQKPRESSMPPSPGMKVTEPDAEVLSSFFGFDPKGIRIGNVRHHSNEVRLNMTKLLQKHMAILAISGAGKSYLTSVLIEELMSRKPEDGQVAIVLLDTHGEYTSFADEPAFSSNIRVVPSSDVRIDLKALPYYHLSRYMKSPSEAQERALMKAMEQLYEENKNFGPKDLADFIERKDDIPLKTKEVLLSCIYELNGLRLFGLHDFPLPREMAVQGGMCVIDLSEEINIRKKRIIADHVARSLFEARRAGTIPPFLLVVEEAHQFAPQDEKADSALSKAIINTIAREGRKFHASLCLISQRPVQLSTTALSQCNTQIIMRVTNPYDLKHIGESSEGITSDVQGQISSLHVGTGLIVGEAVSFPLFVDVRKRNSPGCRRGMPLEKAAIEYHKNSARQREDSGAFM